MPKPSTPAPAQVEAEVETPCPSNRDQLLDMLRGPDGVSIEDLTGRFSWKPHSARAMLTGLRKAGHDVQRSKAGDVTVYKVLA